MLTAEQMNEFKSKLLNRQSQLIHQVQDHFGLEISQTDAVGELSSYDNHPADMATELYERGKDIALNEHTEQELEDINEALHAIEEGTYGICKVCSLDIPLERLVAIPTAKTCVEHAEKNTVKRNRPVEEEVYSPTLPSRMTATTSHRTSPSDDSSNGIARRSYRSRCRSTTRRPAAARDVGCRRWGAGSRVQGVGCSTTHPPGTVKCVAL